MVRFNLASLLRRFRSDERGNIALLMGLLALPMFGAVGYGLDYARMANHKAALNSAASAASLAAVDTARAMILADVNATTSAVTAAASTRALQVFNGQAPASADVSYSPPTIVTNRVGNTLNANVTYSATVTTTLSKVIGVSTMTVNGGNGSIGNLTDGTSSNPDVIIDENFDKFTGTNSNHGYYVDYNNWKTTGSGVEIGIRAAYAAPVPPNGATYMAELDAYNNTSISKKVYLGGGNYELRYYYYSRVPYANYYPSWLCGSKTSDVDWATDTTSYNSTAFAAQTNRIGVYLELAPTDTAPTSYSPTSGNMIDACVIAGANWVERSVKITVNTPGYYWLAFQGEGASDGNGGLLSNIRLCKNTCSGTVTESFPWAQNTLLFQDDFTLPSGIWPSAQFDNYALNISGAATTASQWQNLSAGWTTTPINQVEFVKDSGYDYFLPLDSYDISSYSSNRAVHKKFLLPPGFYKLNYEYSVANDLGAAGTYCGALTTSAINAQIATINSNKSASAKQADTNQLSVYIDADLSFSHPETTTTLYNPAVWKNWNGSTATATRLPSTRIDSCLNATSAQSRAINFKITKPAYYWLTFRAEGDADGFGARIDTIKLTALGGLSTTAPSGVVAVPPPGTAPGTTVTMSSGSYEFITN